MPPLRANHYYGSAVLLPDGPSGSSKVMIISGDQQASTEVIDEENRAGWSNRAPLPVHRRNANSVLTPDGALITIGGNGTNNFDAPRFEALRYNPTADTWTAPGRTRPSRAATTRPPSSSPTAASSPPATTGPAGGGGAVRRDRGLLAALPLQGHASAHHHRRRPIEVGFGARRSPSRSSETSTSRAPCWWRPGATTHANDMHQRLVPLAMSPVTRRLRPHRPGRRRTSPRPGYYQLVLLSPEGVPSEARFLRLGDDAPGASPRRRRPVPDHAG